MTSDELRELCKRRPVIASSIVLWAADELDRLTRRVAELERPAEQWEVIERRDGWIIGKCQLCEHETRIGEYDE